jgi:hypothetical protein
LLDITKVPVYYIGMIGENHSGLERRLKDAGFQNINHSPGVIDPNKAAGVAKAHIKALSKALSETDGPFIILEDDVEIDDFQKKITIPNKADAIYLGLSMWGLKHGKGQIGISAKRDNAGLYRMYNMLAAHAILYINRDYAEFIQDSIPIFLDMGTNQDKMRAETMKYWNIYATRNPVFYQRGKYEKYTKFRLSEDKMVPLRAFYS